jgi:hypothetical protein
MNTFSLKGASLLRPLFLILLAVLAFVGLSTTPALAQTDTFSAGTGNWGRDANWSLGKQPISSNDCVIPSGSVVTGDAAGTCNNFSLAGSASLT